MNDNPQMIVCQNETQAKEESEKRFADLCGMEIDPDAVSNLWRDCISDPCEFTKGKKVIPVTRFRASQRAFIALIELAKAIGTGLQWNKKGRIVLEYDPQDGGHLEVMMFQEADGSDIEPDREEAPRSLPRQEGT